MLKKKNYFFIFLFFLSCTNEKNTRTHIPKDTTQLFSVDLLCEHLDSTRYALNLIWNESKIKIDECNNCQLITNNTYSKYNIPQHARRGFEAVEKEQGSYYYFTEEEKGLSIYKAAIPLGSREDYTYKKIASTKDGKFKLEKNK